MSAQHLTCPFLPDLTCHFLPELEIFRLAWTKGLPGLRRGSDGQRERAAGSIRTAFPLHAEGAEASGKWGQLKFTPKIDECPPNI